MSSLNSFLRTALVTVCVCVNVALSSATSETRIEPAITSNGAIALRIAGQTSEGALSGVREYKIMVSEDLVEWQEINRSRLVEELKLVDWKAAGRPVRFYRLEAVEVDDVIRLFAEELSVEMQELSGYASGIVLDGVTLEEYQQMQATLAEIRTDIIDLLESGAVVPESLLLSFKEAVEKIDETLAESPLRIEYEGVAYEVSISEAMAALNREFERLGSVKLSEYDRLPGVDSEDLEGLNKLEAYLELRRPGLESHLPIFDAFSPHGMFELTHRLLLKHFDILRERTVDTDSDGLLEIDYGLYQNLLNGSERAIRAAEEKVEETKQTYSIDLKALEVSPVLNTTLVGVLQDLDQLFLDVELWQENYLQGLVLDPVFEKLILARMLGVSHKHRREFRDELSYRIQSPFVKLELFGEKTFVLLPEIPTVEEYARRYAELRLWRSEIRDALSDFFEQNDLSPWLESGLQGIFESRYNGYYRGSRFVDGLYHAVWSDFASKLSSGELVFRVGGIGDVFVRYSEVKYDFSRSVFELIELPGVKDHVGDNFIDELVLESEWYRHSSISFYSEGSPVSDSRASDFALGIQIMEVLLESSGDSIAVAGSLDRFELNFLLSGAEVLDEDMVAYLDWVHEKSIQIVERGYDDEGLTASEYEQLLGDLDENLERFERLVGEGVGYEGSRSYRLALSAYFRLFDSVEHLLPQGSMSLGSRTVQVEIDGRSFALGIDWLQRVLQRAAGRVAYGNVFTDEKLARLSGIEQSDLSVLPDLYWLDEIRAPGTAYQYRNPKVGEERISELIWRYAVYFPRLIESFGEDVLAENGDIDDRLIEQRLLRDIETIVPVGETVASAHLKLVREISDSTKTLLSGLDYSKVEAWREAGQSLVAAKRDLAARVVPLIENLSDREIELLEREARWPGWSYGHRYGMYELVRDVYQKGFDQDEVFVSDAGEMLFGVPLREVMPLVDDKLVRRVAQANSIIPQDDLGEIVQLIKNRFTYEPVDRFTEAEILATREVSSYVSYSRSGELEDEDIYSNSWVLEQLVLESVERLLKDPAQLSEPFRSDMFVSGKLNLEVYRRWVLDIDYEHNRLVQVSSSKIDSALEDVRDLAVTPMTLDTIDTVYKRILLLKTEIQNYLQSERTTLSQSDLIEVEESVTQEYRRVFELFVEYLESNDLYVVVGDELRRVPYSEISASLLRELELRFPGESISAYHFASFYGISVTDLIGYDKLESFLNAQIIALPRNSQNVTVVSKLSGVGMRQLVIDLLSIYGGSVGWSGGDLDIDRLLELASDEAQGIERAKQTITTVYDRTLLKIEEEANERDLEGLERALSAWSVWKADAVWMAVNDVSTLSDESLAEVTAYLEELNEEVIKRLIAYVLLDGFRIQLIDGGSTDLDLSSLEDSFLSALGEQLGSPVVPVDESLRLDLMVVFARLITAYGHLSFVDGTFEFENFELELGRENFDRAGALLERLNGYASDEFVRLSLENPDEVELVQIESLSAHFNTSHQNYTQQLARIASEVGLVGESFKNQISEAWSDRVLEYESELKDRGLKVLMGSRSGLVDVEESIRIMDKLHSEGHIEFLDTFAEDGEKEWQYSNLRKLGVYRFSDEDDEGSDSAELDVAQLKQVPGIYVGDLRGLPLNEGRDIELVKRPAEELMTGSFNLRAISPGSSVLEVSDRSYWWWPIPVTYRNLSWRDKRFRVLPLIVEEFEDVLFNVESEFQFDVLEEIIRGAR